MTKTVAVAQVLYMLVEPSLARLRAPLIGVNSVSCNL